MILWGCLVCSKKRRLRHFSHQVSQFLTNGIAKSTWATPCGQATDFAAEEGGSKTVKNKKKTLSSSLLPAITLSILISNIMRFYTCDFYFGVFLEWAGGRLGGERGRLLRPVPLGIGRGGGG